MSLARQPQAAPSGPAAPAVVVFNGKARCPCTRVEFGRRQEGQAGQGELGALEVDFTVFPSLGFQRAEMSEEGLHDYARTLRRHIGIEVMWDAEWTRAGISVVHAHRWTDIVVEGPPHVVEGVEGGSPGSGGEPEGLPQLFAALQRMFWFTHVPIPWLWGDAVDNAKVAISSRFGSCCLKHGVVHV